MSLPDELIRLREFLPELVAEAKKRVPYASALVTKSGGTMVFKTRSEERVNPVPPRPGIRISVWDGATFHSLASSRIDDREYLIRMTRELAESVTVRDGPAPFSGPALDRHYQNGTPQMWESCTKDLGGSRGQDWCRHACSLMSATDSRIVNTQAVWMRNLEFRLFANDARLLSSAVSNVAMVLVPFASDGQRQVMNFHSSSGPDPETVRVSDECATETARIAVALLGAGRVPPGEHRVILDPDLAGTLAHESFGHGCELDTMMRGAARASQFIGRRVGSDLVNIVDFGGLPDRNGSIFFSDDGVPAEEPVVLVKDGILQPTMMTDLYSYTMMRDRMPGLKLSANGRLQTYDHPIYARMTNTYFIPLSREQGGMTLDELIADTGEGILIERMMNGMEDPLGWGIQLQTQRGREIHQGRLTDRLFYRIGMTGYVPDVLSSVDGLTTDLVVESGGSCGKGHKEVVRVSTGGPYVRCRMKLG